MDHWITNRICADNSHVTKNKEKKALCLRITSNFQESLPLYSLVQLLSLHQENIKINSISLELG